TSYDTNLITGNERSPLAHLQRKTAFWLFAPVHRANFERQERADGAPKGTPSGTTRVRAIAAISLRARNSFTAQSRSSDERECSILSASTVRLRPGATSRDCCGYEFADTNCVGMLR